MRLGEPVIVIDPASRRRGVLGTFVDTTPTGDLRIRFADGEVETLGPFQVDSPPDLVLAVEVGQWYPDRESSRGGRAA